MNEFVVIIGQDRDSPLFNARWANESLVVSGNTPEEAFKKLLDYQFPFIWSPTKIGVDVQIEGNKHLGVGPRYIKRAPEEKK